MKEMRRDNFTLTLQFTLSAAIILSKLGLVSALSSH
jgi:hypothetical protein